MAPLARHPFGLRYIKLCLFVFLIRVLNRLSQPLTIGSRKQKNAQGVVRKRINIPSRDKGRSIDVEVYLPPGYDGSKLSPALVNLHG